MVARNYLTEERPDAILNIVDGTNLERNLYLTTQLTELGIPVVVAVNMMDVVNKSGDIIDTAAQANVIGAEEIKSAIEDEDFGAFDEAYGSFADSLAEKGFDISSFYNAALSDDADGVPDPSQFGIWIPGIPVLAERGLEKAGTPDWLNSLLLDGIIGGVGAVLGFVPQMMVLFILLAFLESCGYMARIAFVMDRIFCKFGLSGKSFIPMLIGTGCGVPGIMASRTIECERDRRMTIITTTFIPCGAKLPIIALIAASLFRGAWWVAPSAYFVGAAAIGAIRREMNSAKWTAFAISYQCLFAYAVSLMIFQFGSAFTGSLNIAGFVFAVIILAAMIYMIFRPHKESDKLAAGINI